MTMFNHYTRLLMWVLGWREEREDVLHVLNLTSGDLVGVVVMKKEK